GGSRCGYVDSKLRCPHIHSAYDGDDPLYHASQRVLEKATPFSLTQRWMEYKTWPIYLRYNMNIP
ncbi:MAG: hypothetical protein KJ606_14050, partial [Chloroflexi bacterium]|nr:hypothetical protein [Chloroflexota bacterium]